MNERIKELAEQAGIEVMKVNGQDVFYFDSGIALDEIERFAELVRQDEREACAALCTEMGNRQTNQSLLDPWDCASSIRARSK